jgi:hypothetical protein
MLEMGDYVKINLFKISKKLEGNPELKTLCYSLENKILLVTKIMFVEKETQYYTDRTGYYFFSEGELDKVIL